MFSEKIHMRIQINSYSTLAVGTKRNKIILNILATEKIHNKPFSTSQWKMVVERAAQYSKFC